MKQLRLVLHRSFLPGGGIRGRIRGRAGLPCRFGQSDLPRFLPRQLGKGAAGRGQDEDQGQLGAWYVMASMGLFDVKGLTAPDPSFQLCSPLFDKITISLNPDYYEGREFVIETAGNAPENYYIGSAQLDGKPLTGVQLPFADVVRGGRLKITLAPEPNTSLTE